MEASLADAKAGKAVPLDEAVESIRKEIKPWNIMKFWFPHPQTREPLKNADKNVSKNSFDTNESFSFLSMEKESRFSVFWPFFSSWITVLWKQRFWQSQTNFF